ncbi:hypothetical protein ACWD5Q_34590 [Streptomyces sp. NPDC002513]
MKHTSHSTHSSRSTDASKRRGIKAAVIGAIAAGGLVFSTTSASADGLGGDAWTPDCHAWVAPGDNGHWAYGTLIGLSGCMVRLVASTSTGGTEATPWSYSSTYQLYHADGVHYVWVELHDPTGMDTTGAHVY